MRSLYGSRTPVPNNYFFTFDKIVDNKTNLNNHINDVFIGRCIYCTEDHTVHMRTVSGFLEIAKLDNEGRFIYSEGLILDTNINLNNLLSKGNTYNGNGCYVVDLTKYDKDSLSAEDNRIDLTTLPSIRGMQQLDYLANSSFILEQYSAASSNHKYVTTSEQPKVGVTYYDQNGNPIVITAETAETQNSLTGNTGYQILNDADIITYQTLTEFTGPSNLKKDLNLNRAELSHKFKTFIRTIVYKYSLSTDTTRDGEQTYYLYNNVHQSFIEDTTNNTPSTVGNLYTRSVVEVTEWIDTSEYYTGYLGDLDPNLKKSECLASGFILAEAPFNKYTVYYADTQGTVANDCTEDNFNAKLKLNEEGKYVSTKYYIYNNSNNGNLANVNTLVEAFNALDKILGSSSRINTSETGIVRTIVQGDISTTLVNDFRPYSIPEANIMDALVRVAADIGQVSSIDANNYYNLVFAFGKNEIETNLEKDNIEPAKIYSITSALKKIDHILGSQNRLRKIKNSITGLDARIYTVPEYNVIEAIVRMASELGYLSNELTSAYNIKYDATEVEENFEDITNVNQVNIHSLLSAIKKLDYVAGEQSKLNKEEVKVSDFDSRTYTIPEYNIINALIRVAADLGKISELGNANNIHFTQSEKINKEENGEVTSYAVWSVLDGLIILDKLIGKFSNITEVNSMNTLTDIVTIINNVNENLIGDAEKNFTTSNNNLKKSDNLYKITNKLNELIGEASNFEANNDLTKDNNLYSITNKLNKDLIGDAKTNFGPENDNDFKINNLSYKNNLYYITNVLNTIIGNFDDKKDSKYLKEAKDLISALTILDNTIYNLSTTVSNHSARINTLETKYSILEDTMNSKIDGIIDGNILYWGSF